MQYFYLPLIVAIGLLTAHLMISRCSKHLEIFYKDLSPPQQKLYRSIEETRRVIYTRGLLWALVMVIVYALMIGGGYYCRPTPYKVTGDLLCIITGVPFLYYMVSIKGESMLVNGRLGPEQSAEWYKIYECMQIRFWRGFMMGIAVSSLLFYWLDLSRPRVFLVMSLPNNKSS